MTLHHRLEEAKPVQAYFGRFEGPDHLYVNCPALARVKAWQTPWPCEIAEPVDPLGTDLCGWCVWSYRRRVGAITEEEA